MKPTYTIQKPPFGGYPVIMKDRVSFLRGFSPFNDYERVVKALELYDMLEERFKGPRGDRVQEMVNAATLYDKIYRHFNPTTTVSIPTVARNAINLRNQQISRQLKNTTYPVGSSWIDTVSYDNLTGTLRLNKSDGGFITHLNVPEYIFRRVIQNESVGQAYNRFIKGQYQLSPENYL